jgi:hypothetical protein
LWRVCEQAQTFDFHLQHHRFHIPREHDVAATAQHEERSAPQFFVRQQLQNVINAAHMHQGLRARRDAKAVEGLQRAVFLD